MRGVRGTRTVAFGVPGVTHVGVRVGVTVAV
jgi:hypothetical protein